MRLKLSPSKVYAEAAVMRPGRLVDVDVSGHRVLVHLSGKMCRAKLRIVPLDRVVVALDPVDLTRGILVYRLRDDERFVPGRGVVRVRDAESLDGAS